MRVLLDEQLSPEIARALRDRGLDADSVAERPDLVEAADHAVLDAAFAEQRAVVTNDIKDFRPLAAERLADSRGHAGLILLPATRSRARGATGAPADAIETVMREHSDGIPNAELWIPPPS